MTSDDAHQESPPSKLATMKPRKDLGESAALAFPGSRDLEFRFTEEEMQRIAATYDMDSLQAKLLAGDLEFLDRVKDTPPPGMDAKMWQFGISLIHAAYGHENEVGRYLRQQLATAHANDDTAMAAGLIRASLDALESCEPASEIIEGNGYLGRLKDAMTLRVTPCA